MPEGLELVLQGMAASPGLALGDVALHRTEARRQRESGAPEHEAAALTAAVARATAELEALSAASADEMAEDILAFQIALLEDDDLLQPIHAAIAAGAAADLAWAEAMDREIADYRAGDDEYFQARAADLADLRARVLDALAPDAGDAAAEAPDGAIYAADDLTPSRFLETDWKRYAGAVLRGSSASSHVAMLARARGVPMLVALGDGFEAVSHGAPAILDAERGTLTLHPDRETLDTARRRLAEHAARSAAEAAYLARPAVTGADEPVAVLVNVDEPGLLSELDPAHCDGVGLTRTEFLFHRDGLPDEETQYRVYAEVLGWAGGRPVTVRTLDAGGDKPIPGLTPDGEGNPFLGLRGLRLSLAHPEVFRVQLRALARAAVDGPLKVMAPMVTEPGEMERFAALFDAAVAELEAEGVAAARPPLGMMVEVPAAALTAGAFAADFYSIGSNDLVQYVTATGRDCPAVAALHDPRNPAVRELIARVVAAGRERGAEVSLCGDMAGDPELVPLLLDAGLRRLSVAPARLAATKAAVAAYGSAPGGQASAQTQRYG